MLWCGKVCGLALGAVMAALPALAQQAGAPYADPSVLPANPAPVPAAASSDIGPPPGVPAVADLHVASTALGFERGIAPAPGRIIGYQGQEYLVVEVAAVGNGPTFSGGSRFVITTRDGALEVGLKATDGRDRQVVATSLR
jgi:hypothetical protein